MMVFYNFINLCALFLIYSFFGWIIEVIFSLFNKHKFVNRGFLIGPLIPIWGTGAILITLCLKPDDSIFGLLVSSAFIGTFLEYIVNYLMEKLFNARWWDYSEYPFNINGRVCLIVSCSFGIAGLLVIKILNPLFIKLFLMINESLFCILVSILMFLTFIDLCVSFNIIQKFKFSVEAIRKDYTEEISKKVQKTLMDKSLWFNRLFKAFPNIKFSFKKNKL